MSVKNNFGSYGLNNKYAWLAANAQAEGHQIFDWLRNPWFDEALKINHQYRLLASTRIANNIDYTFKALVSFLFVGDADILSSSYAAV